jgi:hypothetical protein
MGAVSMFQREYPCAVYPAGGVLCLSTLFGLSDVRSRREILRALERAPVVDGSSRSRGS